MRLRATGWIRALATVLLATTTLPTPLEIRSHRGAQDAPFAHAEAVNFEHHADECLGGAAVIHGTPPRGPLLVEARLSPETVVRQSLEPRPHGAEPALRPSSRAPPAPVAA